MYARTYTSVRDYYTEIARRESYLRSLDAINARKDIKFRKDRSVMERQDRSRFLQLKIRHSKKVSGANRSGRHVHRKLSTRGV